MKRFAALCLLLIIPLALLSGCFKKGSDLTVGLITDGGEVNDYGLNEAAWNGIVLASSKYGVNGLYSVPADTTEEAFAFSIKELYDQGCRMIIAPSYVLTDAVKAARSQYKDCTFVCINFAPGSNASNVVSVTFAENEAAFIAGFAAAQTLQQGELAAIFGMDLSSSRRYSGGFKAGVEYSNKNYGTSLSFHEDNIIYAGSYNDAELGKSTAAELYASGVKCIFTDGGKTAAGVFETAKVLRGSGTQAWVVGTITDKYNDGVFEGNRSVTLTTAVSRIGSAISQVVGLYLDDQLSTSIVFDSSLECVGIPTGDANIPKDVRDECDEIAKLIADGTIVVPDEWSELFE